MKNLGRISATPAPIRWNNFSARVRDFGAASVRLVEDRMGPGLIEDMDDNRFLEAYAFSAAFGRVAEIESEVFGFHILLDSREDHGSSLVHGTDLFQNSEVESFKLTPRG
ncbi:MAG: hypothetical protein HQ564_00375 [Candidatus Saganbacteria bacterium]|nr:hypothetical protein [Candidatus Saganbacteria bacterium]